MLAARLLARSDLQFEPMRGLLEPAMRLAIALDHPAYDCAYLALAEARGCDFVTADQAFSRKVIAAGLSLKVIVLSGLTLGG